MRWDDAAITRSPDPHQAVFRALLTAQAHPLRIVSLPLDFGGAAPGKVAAAVAVLEALADRDTPVYAPGLPAVSAPYILCEDPRRASFAVVPGRSVQLADFWPGTPTQPETSATVLVTVRRLGQAGPGACVTLTGQGPGIEARAQLTVADLSVDFPRQWRINRQRFPIGVDVLFCCEGQLAALPRSIDVL